MLYVYPSLKKALVGESLKYSKVKSRTIEDLRHRFATVDYSSLRSCTTPNCFKVLDIWLPESFRSQLYASLVDKRVTLSGSLSIGEINFFKHFDRYLGVFTVVGDDIYCIYRFVGFPDLSNSSNYIFYFGEGVGEFEPWMRNFGSIASLEVEPLSSVLSLGELNIVYSFIQELSFYICNGVFGDCSGFDYGHISRQEGRTFFAGYSMFPEFKVSRELELKELVETFKSRNPDSLLSRYGLSVTHNSRLGSTFSF